MNQISLRGVTIGSPAAQDILAAALPELKPCPFCNNPTAFKLATTQLASDGEEIQVECSHCGAKGPASPKSPITYDWQVAARAWNDYPSTKILPQ